MDLDYWPQVGSIILANIGMFLWATRQARSDYLHMDKKFEDNRKEMNAILQKHTAFIEKHIASNENVIKNFEQRLQAQGK